MAKKRKHVEPDTPAIEAPQHEAAVTDGNLAASALVSNAAEVSNTQQDERSDDLISLHRARFVPWQPTAVVASAASSDGSLVAVAHESGSIEVWETAGWTCRQVTPQCAWHHVKSMPLCLAGDYAARRCFFGVLLLRLLHVTI